MSRLPRQTLLFDGDDTLWDNNVHFERAIDAWLRAVAPGGWTEAAARAELDRVEEVDFTTRGVGKAAFGVHLRQAAATIVPGPALATALVAIDRILEDMPTTAVTPFEGVTATLDELASRHTLGLVTRGDPAEQWAKIDASGLRDRFVHIAVVPHKTPETYRDLVARWGIDPATTTMIGNSPRSDILPARAAGLAAILVTHALSWRLEITDLDPGDDGVRTIARIEDLTAIF
jgi:putative hydrolase of the HAD superfamily